LGTNCSVPDITAESRAEDELEELDPPVDNSEDDSFMGGSETNFSPKETTKEPREEVEFEKHDPPSNIEAEYVDAQLIVVFISLEHSTTSLSVSAAISRSKPCWAFILANNPY